MASSDRKISQLPIATEVSNNMNLLVVSDVDLIPANKRIYIENFFKEIPANVSVGKEFQGKDVIFNTTTDPTNRFTFSGNTGKISMGNDLIVNGDVIISGDINVTGNSTFVDPSFVSLTVNGVFVAENTANFNDDVILQKNLTVYDSSIFHKSVTFNEGINVYGNSVFYDNVDILNLNSTDISATDVNISNTLNSVNVEATNVTAAQTGSFQNVEASNFIRSYGNIYGVVGTFDNSQIINVLDVNNIIYSKYVQISQQLTANNANLQKVSIGTTLNVEGDLTVNGVGYISSLGFNDLYVPNSANIGGISTFNGDVYILGNSYFSDINIEDLTVNQNTYLNELFVSNNSFFQNNLSVSNKITTYTIETNDLFSNSILSTINVETDSLTSNTLESNIGNINEINSNNFISNTITTKNFTANNIIIEDFNVSGNGYIDSNLTVLGTTNSSNTNIVGNINIIGDGNLTGNYQITKINTSNLISTILHAGNLNVTGDSNFEGKLVVEDTITANGNILVNGTTYLKNTFGTGNLYYNGNTGYFANVSVSGTATADEIISNANVICNALDAAQRIDSSLLYTNYVETSTANVTNILTVPVLEVGSITISGSLSYSNSGTLFANTISISDIISTNGYIDSLETIDIFVEEDLTSNNLTANNITTDYIHVSNGTLNIETALPDANNVPEGRFYVYTDGSNNYFFAVATVDGWKETTLA